MDDSVGRVRVVREDEIDAWCGCPAPPSFEHYAAWQDDERAWIDRWRTPASRLFVYQAADGELLGKYDVPIVKARGWELWAPTVRGGPEAGAVMDALCTHLAAEAERQGATSVEVILERAHRLVDLARAGLLRAGFRLHEERVVYAIDLEEPLPTTSLPEQPLVLDIRPATDLTTAELRALCHRAGIPEADDEEVGPGAPGLALGLVAHDEEDRPIALALAQTSPDPAELLDQGIGVIPEARGRGVATTLLHAFLTRASERGATSYVTSTAEDNAPMRKVFEALGGEIVGMRSLFRR